MFGLALVLMAAGFAVGVLAGFKLAFWGIEQELQSGSIPLGDCEYLVKAVAIAPKRQPPACEEPTIDSVLDTIRRDMDREQIPSPRDD
jgi:hypothetical protein